MEVWSLGLGLGLGLCVSGLITRSVNRFWLGWALLHHSVETLHNFHLLPQPFFYILCALVQVSLQSPIKKYIYYDSQGSD